MEESGESGDGHLGLWVKTVGFLTDNVLSHPFVIIRRQCQTNVLAEQFHWTPFTLISPVLSLNASQGSGVFWKGLSSSIAVRWLILGTEDFISKFTNLSREGRSLKKLGGHLALRSISLCVSTPFAIASIVETVQSDLTSERFGFGDFLSEGVYRLFQYGSGRMLPIWILLPPSLFLGISRPFLSSLISALFSKISPYFRRMYQAKTQGAIPKESLDLVYDERLSSLFGLFLSDAILYPIETVNNRLYLQGSRAIVDNLDNGYEVFPVLTAYEGFFDCANTILSKEGIGGFFKGFGALIAQYAVSFALVRFSSIVIREGERFYKTQTMTCPPLPKADTFLDLQANEDSPNFYLSRDGDD